ncbi:hypothetical protein VTG60DRAFT_5344 [Thermothelomyces hinnuleus]
MDSFVARYKLGWLEVLFTVRIYACTYNQSRPFAHGRCLDAVGRVLQTSVFCIVCWVDAPLITLRETEPSPLLPPSPPPPPAVMVCHFSARRFPLPFGSLSRVGQPIGLLDMPRMFCCSPWGQGISARLCMAGRFAPMSSGLLCLRTAYAGFFRSAPTATGWVP